MSKKLNFGYIIPIHVKSKDIGRALKSIDGLKSTTVVVCCSNSIKEWIESNSGELVPKRLKGNKFNYCTSEDTSYQNLVNIGIEELKDKVEYISILEFDDKVNPNAHTEILPYFNNTPDAELYLPLACLVVDNDKKENDSSLQMIAMLNEAPLATGMFEDYGIVDMDTMLKANFVFVNGGYFRTSAFEKYGMFKKNMEILYDYELILRFLNSGCKVVSVPKIARFHFYRPDSEFERQKSMLGEYRDKWLKLAKQEYFFDEDRVIA